MNPKPTNVQSFDLSYTDSEGTEHTLKSGYAMTASGTGYVADVVIQLDQAVNAPAQAVELRDQKLEYNNVSVAEMGGVFERSGRARRDARQRGLRPGNPTT